MLDQKLSDDFSRWEFGCNGTECCNHSAPVMPELIILLQAIRDHFGVPVHINRGFSCLTYNAILESRDDSWHPLGGGADCRYLLNVDVMEIRDYALTIPEAGGFGIYDNHWHVDVRPRFKGEAITWDKRS